MKLVADVRLTVECEAKTERDGARILRNLFKPQEWTDHTLRGFSRGFEYTITKRAVKVQRRRGRP